MPDPPAVTAETEAVTAAVAVASLELVISLTFKRRLLLLLLLVVEGRELMLFL